MLFIKFFVAFAVNIFIVFDRFSNACFVVVVYLCCVERTKTKRIPIHQHQYERATLYVCNSNSNSNQQQR